MITIIICTMNNENTIDLILKNLVEFEVILIDKSVDKTCEIASKYKNVKVCKQNGSGLANARNEGLKLVKTRYVLFLGSDNIIYRNDIFNAIKYIQDNKYVGIGFQTRLLNVNNYLTWCSNLRWKKRFKEGVRKVIGTPYLFVSEILKSFKFDENLTDADDADLCKRLDNNNLKIAISPFGCYEVGFEGMSAVKERFLRYGKSDAQYFKKYRKGWGVFRVIKSLLHPLICEFIFSFGYFPYYIMIVLYRYRGYLKWL